MFTEQLKQELLKPISDEKPCGDYIKLDRTRFRPLRNSFNLAQTSLRKLSQNPDGAELETLIEENITNWDQLYQELLDVFSTSSRDIELIGWFLAAQLMLDNSLVSFANTLEWLAELVSEQWDALNPVLPDNKLKSEDDAGKAKEQSEAKSKAFFQLVGDSEEGSLLYGPFLMLPLINEISFFHYQSVERKGEVSILKHEASPYINSETQIIQSKLESLERALAALDKLAQSSFEQCQKHGVTAPNFNFIKSIIKKFESAMSYLTGIKPQQAFSKQISEQSQVIESSSSDETIRHQVADPKDDPEQGQNYAQVMLTKNTQLLSQVAANNSMNRNVALHQLRELSDYFRQSEPHSPVSFLLEKAIRWGCMPLPEVIKEMLTEPEGGFINKIFDSTGLDHLEQVILPEINEVPMSVSSKNTLKSVSARVQQTQQETQASEPEVADVRPSQPPQSDAAKKHTALSW